MDDWLLNLLAFITFLKISVIRSRLIKFNFDISLISYLNFGNFWTSKTLHEKIRSLEGLGEKDN